MFGVQGSRMRDQGSGFRSGSSGAHQLAVERGVLLLAHHVGVQFLRWGCDAVQRPVERC